MKIRSVIFDMDGTLLNTMEMICKCNNAALKEFNFPQRKYDEFFNFVGDGMRMCVTRALPGGTDENTITKVLSKVLEKYNDEDVATIPAYDGITEMLDELVKRNIKISILTNKEHEYAILNAETVLPQYHFEVIIGERKNKPLKPDPHGVFEISEITGIPLAETIFAGDMRADILTGKNAGVFTVGCLWGFGKKEELEKSGADII
ncbi:MAG TPA: HAD family hydrolase, partial [bacterium]|nr:HAD family hydrolase [bacterium]